MTMACVATPILIAIRADFHDYVDFDIRIILIPVTFAWALLIPLFFAICYNITSSLKDIQEMRQRDCYKAFEGTSLIHIKGRNTKHCSHVKPSDLAHKFILYSIVIAFFFYFAFFLKIYCFGESASFTALSPIAFVPAIALYWKEMYHCIVLNNQNFKRNKNHLLSMIAKYG
jgi:hypothetical protein